MRREEATWRFNKSHLKVETPNSITFHIHYGTEYKCCLAIVQNGCVSLLRLSFVSSRHAYFMRKTKAGFSFAKHPRATQSRWSISKCLCNNNLNNWKISFHSWFIRSGDRSRSFSFGWSSFASYLMKDRPFFIRCHCELFSGGHCMREKHWLEFYIYIQFFTANVLWMTGLWVVGVPFLYIDYLRLSG